jgi:hypothetical protein
MTTRGLLTRSSSDAFALTIPREPLQTRRGGKIEFRARLVFPAHTSRGNNTELKKYLG